MRIHGQCATECHRLFFHAAKATFRIEQKAPLRAAYHMLGGYAQAATGVLKACTISLLKWQFEVQPANGQLQVKIGGGPEAIHLVNLGHIAAFFPSTDRAHPSSTPPHDSSKFYGAPADSDPNIAFDLEPLQFSVCGHADHKNDAGHEEHFWIVESFQEGKLEAWAMSKLVVAMPKVDAWEDYAAPASQLCKTVIRTPATTREEARWQITARYHIDHWDGVNKPVLGVLLDQRSHAVVPTPYTPKYPNRPVKRPAGFRVVTSLSSLA
jgi:hypothetical protein